jgi:hypothetical protein
MRTVLDTPNAGSGFPTIPVKMQSASQLQIGVGPARPPCKIARGKAELQRNRGSGNGFDTLGAAPYDSLWIPGMG